MVYGFLRRGPETATSTWPSWTSVPGRFEELWSIILEGKSHIDFSQGKRINKWINFVLTRVTHNSHTTDKPVALVFLIELEFRNVDFCGGRKTVEPGEKPSEEIREPTTNWTHLCHRVQELNRGHIGGRWVRSPQHHPCSPEQWEGRIRRLEKESINYNSLKYRAENSN